MKILLTGIAGTGKSTIVQELNKRDIFSIDLHEVPNMFFWQNMKTKQKVPYTPVHSKQWFDTMERLCDIELLKKILSQYSNVVMAGTTGQSNRKEFLSFFDKVILLQASPEILVHRLQTRTNTSGFGKTNAEQEDNIEWQKEFDPELLSYGAIPIHTEGDLTATVDQIISSSS